MLQCLAEQLGYISNLQPPHQIEAVHFHCAHADLQPACNVAVRVTLRNQFQNFLLTGVNPSDRFPLGFVVRAGCAVRAGLVGERDFRDPLTFLDRTRLRVAMRLCPKFYC